MDKNRKLSDKEFFAILRESGGLFARTAREIEKKYGISFSRQSARERALKYPEILEDIHEETLDIAEDGLHSIMKDETINQGIRLTAILQYLRMRGRKRGYVERVEGDFTVKQELVNLDGLTAEQREELFALARAYRKHISKASIQSSGDEVDRITGEMAQLPSPEKFN